MLNWFKRVYKRWRFVFLPNANAVPMLVTCDASCVRGVAAYAYVIRITDGTNRVFRGGLAIPGHKTSREAEIVGAVESLHRASKLGATHITLHMDCQSAICYFMHYKRYPELAQAMGCKIQIRYVPGHGKDHNQVAKDMAECDATAVKLRKKAQENA